jgi:hypothetical protein
VRIVRWKTERPVDLRLQLFGDHVFQALRLDVDVVDGQAQRLREVQLEQPMMPDHLERDLLARKRQIDPAIRLVHGEFERGELLHHRAGRSRGHSLALR